MMAENEQRARRGKEYADLYLNFQYDEHPFWHPKAENQASVQDMLLEVKEFCSSIRYTKVKDSVFKKFRDLFILQMSKDEDLGIQNEDDYAKFLERGSDPDDDVLLSLDQVETKNMWSAFKHLQDHQMEAGGEFVLTEDVALAVHTILMKNFSRSNGQLCKNPRRTTDPFTDKIMYYPQPEFVANIFPTLFDHSNYMVCFLKNELEHEETDVAVGMFIKFCAWFFFNFIHLHPFGDGNGRMARLLCCYLQSILMKLPVGTYNIFSPSTKKDYLQAICNVRERNVFDIEKQFPDSDFQKNQWQFQSKPSELATMILECMWNTCKEYILISKTNP